MWDRKEGRVIEKQDGLTEDDEWEDWMGEKRRAKWSKWEEHNGIRKDDELHFLCHFR